MAKLPVAPRDTDGEVGDIRSGQGNVDGACRTGLAHDVAQTDVVDPQLRRVHDRGPYAPHPRRDLLHAREVRWRGARIAHVRDVRAVAHDI